MAYIVFMCYVVAYSSSIIVTESRTIYIYFHAMLDARYVIYVLTIKLGHCYIHLIYLATRSQNIASHLIGSHLMSCVVRHNGICLACLNPANGPRFSR